jgi:redox-sensitive bicupin YhaK (pirin superfamily)
MTNSELTKSASKASTRQIEFILPPTEQHWVGDGFFVHTLMHPHPRLVDRISPFLLLDYAPPRSFTPSLHRRGVGEHPHRGFETVTFAYAGEVEHRDSAGGGGKIESGDVQWMTAGSGLVHEEKFSRVFSEMGGEFEMVQLWVNLPKTKKMMAPRYQALQGGQFPKLKFGQTATGRLIAGELTLEGQTHQGPALTNSPMLVMDLRAEQDGVMEFPVSSTSNTLLLLRKGKLRIGEQQVPEKSLAVLSLKASQVGLELSGGSELLVLSGEPLGEPVFAHGPFVMNTREEIVEAIEDYQAGRMGHLDDKD